MDEFDGIVVVSLVYYSGPNGRLTFVMKDDEGIQIMRTLAQNITYLLKSIESGKNGLSKPVYEETIDSMLYADTLKVRDAVMRYVEALI